MKMDIDLDLDELFYLAIKASEKGDHEKAIIYLKKGAEEEGSARFYYLLGAEHAEIGMYERAISDIESALELQSDIWEAWFQLGLLNAMLNRAEQALIAWANLDTLGSDNQLYLFKSAIIFAFDKNWKDALSFVDKGLTIQLSNPALVKDMQKLRNDWLQKLNEVNEPIVEDNNSEENGHLFLSAYKEKH